MALYTLHTMETQVSNLKYHQTFEAGTSTINKGDIQCTFVGSLSVFVCNISIWVEILFNIL